jgi:peptidoglycan glycosyltransferase
VSIGSPPGIGGALIRVALVIAVGFGGLAASTGYWGVLRAGELTRSPDDAAVVAAARRAIRGAINDRDGRPLAWNERDANGEPYRIYASRSVSGVLGYASRRWGTAGLERAYDALLTGVVTGDPVLDMVRKFRADTADPQALRTTLVLPLQDAAAAALDGDPGAVVILDPRTGDILALVSSPTFDASGVAHPDRADATFEAALADPALPLLPRATSGAYVPGSVFKIVTAIAALGSGAVSPDTTFPEQPPAERDGLLVDGYRVRDGHHRATGGRALDFEAAVEVSCNVWFALAGLETGGERLADWSSRLGFGAPLAFDLPTAASQLTNGGGSFGGGLADAVELANAAYGQAETLVSPLQMALVAATVANDGVLVEPRLVLETSGRAGTRETPASERRRILPAATAQVIAAAMRRAVDGELGRVYTAGAQVRGLAVAGKSGTAELDGPIDPHSWFIGFAPVDDAAVVIAVVVERGGRGAERAAPIAGDLFRAWLRWSGG